MPHVDQLSARSDADPHEGSRVRVTSGPHKGLVGAFIKTESRDKDGFPKRIIVRTLDHQDHIPDSMGVLAVDYKDVLPHPRERRKHG